jgi:hypothetical protein
MIYIHTENITDTFRVFWTVAEQLANVSTNANLMVKK